MDFVYSSPSHHEFLWKTVVDKVQEQFPNSAPGQAAQQMCELSTKEY